MIVREEPDGSLLLINQTDHAAISGLFAAHWGNSEFERPHPSEAVVRAAIFHDAGWYRYQTSPRYDTQAGKTLAISCRSRPTAPSSMPSSGPSIV